MKIVILAGGRGTRLWPISRESFPKQFLKINSEDSLLQQTVKRFSTMEAPHEIFVVTNNNYYFLVKNQLQRLFSKGEDYIITEPVQKNTGPAVVFALKYLQQNNKLGPKETILISSSDYWIESSKTFSNLMQQAQKLAEQERIVAFGVSPTKPETGYGYMHIDSSTSTDAYEVLQFIEKPNYEKALEYLQDGTYLWNSGIYVFRFDVFLKELNKYTPSLSQWMERPLEELYQEFHHLEASSIDCDLMEKTKQMTVVPLRMGWSDIGNWDTVFEVLNKDVNQNVTIGNVHTVDTKNSLIFGNKRLISLIGLDDILMVETEDAIFLGKKGCAQKVKELVEDLKRQGNKEIEDHLTTYRPWGYYKILETGERYKVKRIVVESGQSLSLQMHYHRSEHWVVIKGTAQVTTGDHVQKVHENESIYVSKGAIHRLENLGKIPLELIEVQVGEYLGEDDIVRFKDIYARL